MATAAHLDTHIALWLHDALIEKISARQMAVIETFPLFISEFVRLELQYLHEIGRICIAPNTIIGNLAAHAEVTLSTCPLHAIVGEAMKMDWTRDPFDRLIAANAQAEKAALLTQDSTILRHFRLAVA